MDRLLVLCTLGTLGAFGLGAGLGVLSRSAGGEPVRHDGRGDGQDRQEEVLRVLVTLVHEQPPDHDGAPAEQERGSEPGDADPDPASSVLTFLCRGQDGFIPPEDVQESHVGDSLSGHDDD